MMFLCLRVLAIASISLHSTAMPSSHSFHPTRSSLSSIITFTANSTDQVSHVPACFPPSWDELLNQGLLKPINNCSSVAVLSCYCLTSEDTSNGSRNDHGLMFGNCFYGCLNYDILTVYYELSYIDQELENTTCSIFNRKGVLCGQCKDGYAPSAYTFSLRCVKCDRKNYWTRIIVYVLVAYGPLTLFLTFIVFFTVSVNSAPLRGWIFVCQLISTSVITRLLTAIVDNYYNTYYRAPLYITGSVYGMWNLDFFRVVYSPFCLHPDLTTLQVMSLDYIIASYPLILIAVTYTLVNLYSYGWKPIVLLWRPFHYIFTRFRYRLNIRTSLIDAFGTFFTLSYVKFLSTTVDLISATKVWDYNGQVSHHIYYDGTMEEFKGRHIPYVITAVLVTLICNILPLVLIVLYSFRRTISLLNYLPSSVQLTLFLFMDNILGCYKNGTNGTRNCRYFGAVHHFTLMVIFVVFLFIKSIFLIGVMATICIILGMLIAVIQPYKSNVHNIASTILILSVGLGYGGCMLYFITFLSDPVYTKGCGVVCILPFYLPLFYIVGYVGVIITSERKRTIHCIFAKAKYYLYNTVLTRNGRRHNQRENSSGYSAIN